MPRLSDELARQKALDISKSFIVQAPAGSGKTGLLVQRMLSLLANAKKYPEECLAITFTKKAANEMRQRIVLALSKASTLVDNNVGGYEEKTINIAKKVLKRDKELDWNLLKNPDRIKVQTIDALCAKIISNFPVTIKYGVSPSILEDAAKIYEEAATNFITDLCEDEGFIKLANRYDNNLSFILKSLTSLLASREQWLPIIFTENHGFVIDKIVEHELNIILNIFSGRDSIKELPRIAYFAANGLDLELRDQFIKDDKFVWPEASTEGLRAWKFLSNIVLTSSGQVRKTINKNQGFIKPNNKEDQKIFIEYKKEILNIFDVLNDDDELVYYFNKVSFLPLGEICEEQLNLSVVIKELFPKLVAYLQLVFKKYGAIDFTEMMLSAIVALGDEDEPSDINLEIDAKLNHILVDEFQDTSKTQIKLLELLVSGWSMDDGRTIFLVGDPMQSIYKFRQADVGMYLKIRKHGIGNLKLIPINLNSNFRSAPKLVYWVNDNMKECFSSYDDISTSKVKFTDSQPQKIDNECIENPINALLFTDLTSEAEYIANKVKEYKNIDSSISIAILVRSRTQLPYIIQSMQSHKISYIGINIESLFNRPWVQEFLILFKALNHWYDDIAWFSLLRCSLCGLNLVDLTILSGGRIDESIWELLQSEELLATLSEEGRKRVQRLKVILKKFLLLQGEQPFGEWLYNLWLGLGGMNTLANEYQLEDMRLIFNLLQQSQDNDNIFDTEYLEDKISKMFADQISSQSSNPVNIMTIHKSKGLEFDVVFVPGLNYSGKQDDKLIISWHQDKIGNEHKAIFHVNSSIKSKSANELLKYLDYIRIEKKKNEDLRLLYVALTRAKSSLELLGSVVDKRPNEGTFQSMLWPYLENMASLAPEVEQDRLLSSDSQKIYALSTKIVDLDLADNKYFEESLELEKISINEISSDANWYMDLGTFIHNLLATIANGKNDLNYWLDLTNERIFKNHIYNFFANKGYGHKISKDSIDAVVKALQGTINDDFGKWILSSNHDWSVAEWQLSSKNESTTEIEVGIADRIILDKNTCWIIDYKVCNSVDIEKEISKYKSQLSRYVRLARKNIKAESYTASLYFPLQTKFVKVLSLKNALHVS